MILRLGICIPTYNNQETIESVLQDCLRLYPFPIIVVDDGSNPSVLTVLKNSEVKLARESGRLTVLVQKTNRGKGQALTRAIRYAIKTGLTHLITIDGDGQHLPSEISHLVKAIKKWPWDLIIGARNMDNTAPGISHFGRRFSNFWVKYQTDIPIKDSQSGFRAYPLFFVQNLKFWTSHYDFEIEVLVKAMWKGISLREVEVNVYYPLEQDRVSHFDKLWDNVRISLLNTAFVVLSLIRRHTNPKEGALAVGAGVFIGCTPLFGLHTLIAGVLSFVFRLNFGIMWLGTQVSLPPFIPFLVVTSVVVGSWVMGEPMTWSGVSFGGDIGDLSLWDWAHQGIVKWSLGAIFLGLFLGSLVGSLWYGLARWLQRPKVNWTGRTRGGKWGNSVLRFLLKKRGLSAGYAMLYLIVPYFYLFAPRARWALNEYWVILDPTCGFWSRQTKILSHFLEFGKTLMDQGYERFSSSSVFKVGHHFNDFNPESLAAHRAQLILTTHMGSWGLVASLFNKKNKDSPLYKMQFEANDSSAFTPLTHEKEKGVVSLRARQGQLPVLQVQQLLNQGQSMALMGDRPLDGHFELVPFMGKLAPWPTTPFRIALATGAEVVASFGLRENQSDYGIWFYPLPVEALQSSNKLLRAREAVIQYVNKVETMIQAYPKQWFNFYNFWSSLPTLPSGKGCLPQRYYLLEELQGSTGVNSTLSYNLSNQVEGIDHQKAPNPK